MKSFVEEYFSVIIEVLTILIFIRAFIEILEKIQLYIVI